MNCNFCGNNMNREQHYCPVCGKMAIRELGEEENDIYVEKVEDSFSKKISSANMEFSNPYIGDREEYFKPSEYSGNKSKSKITVILSGIIIIAMIVGIGMYFFSGRNSSPIEPVKGYIECLSKGKIKESMEYTNFKAIAGNDKLGDTLLEGIESEFEKQGVADVFKIFETVMEDNEYNVISETNDSVIVTVKMSFMGQTQETELKVIKVNSEWKIDLQYGMKKI